MKEISIHLSMADGSVVEAHAKIMVSSVSRGAQMDVADLPDGTYYLNVLKDGQVTERQVVLVKH